jgi:hypothetical protein
VDIVEQGLGAGPLHEFLDAGCPPTFTPNLLTAPRQLATRHSTTAKRLAITDEASPFALRSTRKSSEDSSAPGCDSFLIHVEESSELVPTARIQPSPSRPQTAQDGYPVGCSPDHV